MKIVGILIVRHFYETKFAAVDARKLLVFATFARPSRRGCFNASTANASTANASTANTSAAFANERGLVVALFVVAHFAKRR